MEIAIRCTATSRQCVLMVQTLGLYNTHTIVLYSVRTLYDYQPWIWFDGASPPISQYIYYRIIQRTHVVRQPAVIKFQSACIQSYHRIFWVKNANVYTRTISGWKDKYSNIFTCITLLIIAQNQFVMEHSCLFCTDDYFFLQVGNQIACAIWF